VAESTAPAGRVVVFVQGGAVVQSVRSSKSWQVEYRFRVPPLPSSPTFDPGRNAFYVGGNVDFDRYGADGHFTLSDHRYNLVAPQLFIGHVLSGNDASFAPSWTQFDTWAIQAQYVWENNGTLHAQTGPVVSVQPGDAIATVITFDSGSGRLSASISAPGGTSAILIERPFPNQPSLFSSWADFFQQAEALSGLPFVYMHPGLDVEPYADTQTLCSILPFTVDLVSIPGIPPTASYFDIFATSEPSCERPLASLQF